MSTKDRAASSGIADAVACGLPRLEYHPGSPLGLSRLIVWPAGLSRPTKWTAPVATTEADSSATRVIGERGDASSEIRLYRFQATIQRPLLHGRQHVALGRRPPLTIVAGETDHFIGNPDRLLTVFDGPDKSREG